MKPIYLLFLLALSLSLPSCECEETIPLIGAEEAFFPESFRVTGLDYTFVLDDNIPRKAIRIEFNRELDRQSVIPNETVFLEGKDVFYQEAVRVDSNLIILFCNYFYCISGSTCEPTVRLIGDGSRGIQSISGEALDGDRDGRGGGDFSESIAVDDCAVPVFRISTPFPDTDTLRADFQIFEDYDVFVRMNLVADRRTVIPNENVRIERAPDNQIIPINFRWIGGVDDLFRITIPVPDNFCIYDGDCEFFLIIEDSVISGAGTPLDGDDDGDPGGDYVKKFFIEG